LLAQILELPLVPSWRSLFERRRSNGQTENWHKRLTGLTDSH
jgi:hypothetical protein